MSERGVIYMAWGQNAIEQAKQSVGSLRRFLPKIPVMVVGDQAACDAFAENKTVLTHFCNVNPFNPDQKKGYTFLAGRVKPLLDGISPWDETLYVDADTYFQQSPMEGFNLLKRWDVALAETQTRCLGEGIAGKEECEATAEELGARLLLYHNSGMIFWRKNERTKALFELWGEEWRRYQGWDEQVAFLRALMRSEAVFKTLPYTWNHSGLNECYMLSHWFGAGDARVDMTQRVRQLRPETPKTRANPMIKIEIGPGQFVRCRPENELEVRKMYGLDVSKQLVKETDDMKKDNPLVKVPCGRPGEYVKMRKKDAIAQGLQWEPERNSKMMVPEGNKILEPEGNKSVRENAESVRENAESVRENAESTDFTEISGVGQATDKALHEHGIHTFEDLMTAEISFLSGRVVRTIEKWRLATPQAHA